MKELKIIPEDMRCQFCGKPATKLCDCPKGYRRYVGHPPRTLMDKAHRADIAFSECSMSTVITCDKRMCDDCATRIIADIDFCPDCMKRIKSRAQGGNKNG